MKSEEKSEKALSPKKAGLSKAARDLLARVRASPSPEQVFGLEPAAADARARGAIDPLIEGAALPLTKLNQYRWFVAELCRLMRTRSGPDLAYCMELSLKKWLGFGLEPNTVVFLAGELFDRLGTRASPNDETRMTIEARRTNDQDEPPRGQESGRETAKVAKIAKVPEPEGETAKSAKNVKVRTGSSADDADCADEVSPQSPANDVRTNDERRTRNDVTTPGGG